MKPLHKIPKEPTNPTVTNLQAQAITGFQIRFGDTFRIHLYVRRNAVTRVGYNYIHGPAPDNFIMNNTDMRSYTRYNTENTQINWQEIVTHRS